MPQPPRLRQQLSARERSRSWRLRFRLREAIARSLVLLPSLYIVAALLLGWGVPRLEGERDLLEARARPGHRPHLPLLAGERDDRLRRPRRLDRGRRRHLRREPVHAAAAGGLPPRPGRQARARRLRRADDLRARLAARHRPRRLDDRPQPDARDQPAAADRRAARLLRARQPADRPAAPAARDRAGARARRRRDRRDLSVPAGGGAAAAAAAAGAAEPWWSATTAPPAC